MVKIQETPTKQTPFALDEWIKLRKSQQKFVPPMTEEGFTMRQSFATAPILQLPEDPKEITELDVNTRLPTPPPPEDYRKAWFKKYGLPERLEYKGTLQDFDPDTQEGLSKAQDLWWDNQSAYDTNVGDAEKAYDALYPGARARYTVANIGQYIFTPMKYIAPGAKFSWTDIPFTLLDAASFGVFGSVPKAIRWGAMTVKTPLKVGQYVKTIDKVFKIVDDTNPAFLKVMGSDDKVISLSRKNVTHFSSEAATEVIDKTTAKTKAVLSKSVVSEDIKTIKKQFVPEEPAKSLKTAKVIEPTVVKATKAISDATKAVAKVEPVLPSAIKPTVKASALAKRSIESFVSKFPAEMRGSMREYIATHPEDIIRQVRGVVSEAETLKQAKALTDELGVEFSIMLSKTKPGTTWNAPMITAVKGLLRVKQAELSALNKLITTGANTSANLVELASKIGDYDTLMKTIIGTKAEWGRAGQALRALAPAGIKDLPISSLERLVRVLGGRAKIEQISKLLATFNLDDPGQFAAAIRTIIKPKANDYLTELFYNSILSSPKTHIINIMSNVFNAVLNPAEKILAATVELPTAFLQGRPRQRFFGEAAQDIFGLTRGLQEGVGKAGAVWKGQVPLEATSKWELPRVKAFTGTAGRIINTPTTVLEMGDALLYGVNRTIALRTEAYRWARATGKTGDDLADEINRIINDPPVDLLKAAHETAEYRLFRGEPGKVVQRLMDLRDADLMGVQPLRYIVPFLRTPTNLVKYGLERSPLGLLNWKMWRSLATKSPEFADSFGRVILGSTIAAGVGLYAADGKITGAPPRNAAERERFYNEGKVPYAIKIGDTWVSYQRLEPFNQPIAQISAVIDAVNAGEDNESVFNIATIVAQNIGTNFVSQTFMQNFSDLIAAIENPKTSGENFLARLTGGMIPFSAALRTAEQIISPDIEDPHNIIQRVESSIPGLSSTLDQKLSAFGEPITRTSSAWFPIQISKEKTSPLINEMNRLEINIGSVGSTIWGVSLTKEEISDYQTTAGANIKLALEAEINSSDYQKTTSDDWKKKQLDKVISKARADAQETMLHKLYDEDQLTSDQKLVFEYQQAITAPDVPENKRGSYGIKIREARPDIDVALNLSGAASTVQTKKALVLLIQRAVELGIDPETLPAVQKMGVPKGMDITPKPQGSPPSGYPEFPKGR